MPTQHTPPVRASQASTASQAHQVDPADRRPAQPRWRLVVLITVLAGFFLMHGLSDAGSCAGALASLPADVHSNVAMAASAGSTEVHSAPGDGASHASTADQCCSAMGTLCVPQRPQDSAWLLVLLLGLAVLVNGEGSGRLMDAIARTARGRRRRPGSATSMRLMVCVSRT